MATYRRRTTVRAPFESVWRFHDGAEGLEELTPGVAHLEIERVTGPDGEPDPGILAAGSTLEASIRPFGVGPRWSWTSHIVDRTEDDGAAMFRDEMASGPFPRWEHTHLFFADGSETVVEDRVEYELPGGSVGRSLSPLGVLGLEPTFRYRHRKTREILGT